MLACAYWTRHDRAPVGHRGPWTSHALAVERSARIIDAAVTAGVSRLVWTSIANPGLDPDLSYYAGKAAVERLVERSGLPHAILRPACFFGPGGILIENIAWAARRLPCFPIPAGPRYRIRPIHLDDYADAVVDAVGATGTFVRDATGPDRVEFGEIVSVPFSRRGSGPARGLPRGGGPRAVPSRGRFTSPASLGRGTRCWPRPASGSPGAARPPPARSSRFPGRAPRGRSRPGSPGRTPTC